MGSRGYAPLRVWAAPTSISNGGPPLVGGPPLLPDEVLLLPAGYASSGLVLSYTAPSPTGQGGKHLSGGNGETRKKPKGRPHKGAAFRLYVGLLAPHPRQGAYPLHPIYAPRAASSARRIASTVASTSALLCAVLMNPVSYGEGATYTPCSSMERK